MNWQYPAWLASMGLVLMGSWALLRLMLPHHPIVAYGLAPFISLAICRFGPRPKPTSTPQTVWIGNEAYSFFGFRQAVLNGIGFFVLLTTVLAWLVSELPILFDVSMAAIGGLIFAAFGVDLQAKKPSAGPEAESWKAWSGIGGKLRNLITARFLIRFIILSSIFEISGLWQQPFRSDVLLFAIIAGLVVAAISQYGKLEDDAARTSNA